MTDNPLDLIEARANAAQGAWEEFQLGTATKGFALEEANNSATDVMPLVQALRAVEAVHVLTCEVNGEPCDTGERCSVAICGPCGESWPCPTITAIREALG